LRRKGSSVTKKETSAGTVQKPAVKGTNIRSTQGKGCTNKTMGVTPSPIGDQKVREPREYLRWGQLLGKEFFQTFWNQIKTEKATEGGDQAGGGGMDSNVDKTRGGGARSGQKEGVANSKKPLGAHGERRCDRAPHGATVGKY